MNCIRCSTRIMSDGNGEYIHQASNKYACRPNTDSKNPHYNDVATPSSRPIQDSDSSGLKSKIYGIIDSLD